MLKLALVILSGLCLGSFINALVWRIKKQSNLKKPSKVNLSILNGRSVCPKCNHILSFTDLFPVVSYVMLGGKCRYCKKSISIQYPLVELFTATTFVISFYSWSFKPNKLWIIEFILWLVLTTGLIALALYDFKWKLLPSRIIYPLFLIALLYDAYIVASQGDILKSLANILISSLIGGGIFYVIYQVSNGKWIGGGDVRLGYLLGLIAATPTKSILVLFFASLSGLIFVLPFIVKGKYKRNTTIPFGPFLILGLYISVLWGSHIINWYQSILL